MIPILDWIFEGIVNWIASIASTILDAVSGLFLEALGTDMTAMEEYFPFITKAYGTLQYTSWAILYLIVMWQIFRAFGGPITEAENPWHLVIRGAIYGLLIGYAKNIAMFCLEIARIPYTSLLDISMTGEDFTFAGVEEVLTNGLTTIVAASTVAGLILVLILLIALGWNYFKLLLETVERYIVVGVLCYTSPLAFSMGGSKTTNNVFKSWCRMVGSQLLLLVMNVWFLRGFASSMGHFIGNGGALTTGKGSIFLWMFCALAYLRCAQRFDSYLSSLGLNVAQTGSSMAMEMMMAARVVSGMGGGAKSAGSVFGGKTGSTATGTGAAASGFAAGFASKFSPNSYVRDAVVEGGSNIGFGGGAGFMGRAFGGMAARNGATLNGDSISSVASRAPSVSGSIGGEIADRSLSNYMPHMQGFQMKGTQISGGHISTTATTPDGKTASVDMYSASQFEKPEVPHSVVTASDGSQWYQMASGEGRGAFYDAPVFGGVSSDSVQEAAAAMEDQAVASSIGAEVEAIQQGMGAYPGTGMPDSSGEEVAMPGGEAPAFGTQFVQGTEGELPGGITLDGTQEMQQGMPVLSQDAVTGETLTESAGEAQPFGAGFVGSAETLGQTVTEDAADISMPILNQSDSGIVGSEDLQQDAPFGAGFISNPDPIPAPVSENQSEDLPGSMPAFQGGESGVTASFTESLQQEGFENPGFAGNIEPMPMAPMEEQSGEAIRNMADALKMTLYGSLGSGESIPLTDAELLGIVGSQNCNDTRKLILTTALSLVGKVPYFWGGKSEAGWNDEWNKPKLVTSAGSSSTGTIRPFGLDCSGFTDWVYKTALGVSIQAGSWGQYTHSSPISESELLPGDLGFLMNAQGTTSHVLIFAGYTESGARQWVHSESGTGVHVSTPRYDSELVLRRPNNVDFSQDVGSSAYGDPLYSLTVDVTHYCACTRCCGPNAQGITASGKRVTEGMVAMSSHYPFGTQIMINGVMYTVEDRGGSGIENDISRVDIYVSDHNYALRLGRFKTTAYIYRLGR